MNAHPMPLDALRAALLELAPANDNSFEELVGIALRYLTGASFQQSSSGIQGGFDGITNNRDAGIAYECKRYSDDIKRADVVNKIGECALSNNVDLFILAATSSVGAQTNEVARNICHQNGLELLVLDWSSLDRLPKLVTALAQAPDDELKEFLQRTDLSPSRQTDVLSALSQVRFDPDYKAATDRLKNLCDISLLSFEAARRSNEAWLLKQLAEKAAARRAFGQPLAPLDKTVLHRPQRPVPTDQIRRHFSSRASPCTLAITGDEGTGKSWSVMTAWAGVTISRPMLLFVRPDIFDERRYDLADVVGRVLREQMIDFPPSGEARWARKVRRWLSSAIPQPGIVVVLDGINQKPQHPWSSLIDRFDDELSRLGGRLVVSSRPIFLDQYIARSVRERLDIMPIGNWSVAEATAILVANGQEWQNITSGKAKRALLNPRLLSVALDLLERQEIEDLNSLSAPHLLFAHIQAASDLALGPDPAAQFKDELKERAKVLMSNAATDQDLTAIYFKSKVPVEGQFFRTTAAEPLHHVIDEFGLPLVLGLYILEGLNLAPKSVDLVSRLNELMDPIAALDEAGHAMSAALVAAFLTNGVRTAVRTALISGLAGLQNTKQEHFQSMRSVAHHDVTAHLDAVESMSKSPFPDRRRYAILDVLVALRRRPKIKEIINERATRWLRTVEAWDYRIRRLAPPGTADSRVEHSRQQHAVEMGTLSPGQREFFDQLVVERVDTTTLTTSSVRLLVGQPLASFAPAIASHILYQSLYSGHGPDLMLADLVTFNEIDWKQAQKAIRAIAAPWAEKPVTRLGRRAAGALLRTTGDSDDALSADALDGTSVPKLPPMNQAGRASPENPNQPSVNTDDVETFLRTSARELRAGHQASRDFAQFGASAARVRPERAAEVIEALANHIANGNSEDLPQQIELLRPHAQLLSSDMCTKLSCLGREVLISSAGTLGASHAGRVQLAIDILAVCLPSLPDGIQFVSSIAAPSGAIAVKLDANEELVSRLYLHQGAISGHAPTSVLSQLPALMQTGRTATRHAALCWLTAQGSASDLGSFVNTPWSASTEKDAQCAWLGSIALARALSLGVCSAGQVLSRISVAVLGVLMQVGAASGDAFERAVDGALANIKMPRARENGDNRTEDDRAFMLAPLTAGSMPTLDAEGKLEAVKSAARALVRNRRIGAAGGAMPVKAAPDSYRLCAFGGIVDPTWITRAGTANPALVAQWATQVRTILQSTEHRLVNALTISVLVGTVELPNGPDLAEVHATLEVASRHVRSRLIVSSILWAAPDGPAINELRLRRIDNAKSDQNIFIECEAAASASREAILVSRMTTLMTSVEPVEPQRLGRAITVLGYLLKDGDFEKQLGHLRDAGGLVRMAFDEVVKFRQRDEWARDWESRLTVATGDLEHWQASLLLTRTSDRRVLRRVLSTNSPWATTFKLHSLAAAAMESEHQDGRKNALLCGRRKPEVLHVSKNTS